MPATTFGDVWRLVRLHTSAPFALCRDWTQSAYEELCERRPWVWQTRETRLSPRVARAITATFTQDSQTITSAAAFVASDAGRQIRVGTYPYYTITVVQDASNAVLDLAYAATGGALTAQILDAYQTMPADFGAFILVADPTVQRQIGYWWTPEQLAAVDIVRTSSGDPQRALVAATPSPEPTTLGQMRYEWWPAPVTARSYPAWYRARPATLSDTDPFTGVLAQRAKILETGALARCARWPGTADAKNPYFNLPLSKMLQDDFDQDCARLELRDDDQSQQSWVALPYHRWPAWGMDLGGGTSDLRASDATIYDYI